MIEHPKAKERIERRAEEERQRQKKIVRDTAALEEAVDQLLAEGGADTQFSIEVTTYEREAVHAIAERYHAAGWDVSYEIPNPLARVRVLKFS
jgi:hypothetical protein